jgi:uncharacterized protein
MMKEIFGSGKPIIAMVHLQEFEDVKILKEDAFRDIDRLRRGGVDALLFENWGGDRIGRHATPQVKERMIEVMKESARRTDLPFGVNVLSLDYEASFEIAKATGAKFVQLDTLVDVLKPSRGSSYTLEINPDEVNECRKRNGLMNVALFTNIQTKHYITVPEDKPLEKSAVQAIRAGSDALVVTGRVTGDKTPLEKVLRTKKVSGGIPVFIGSGLDAQNAAELLAHADGAIVGTSIKKYGMTDNPVDEARVKELMAAVARLR